MGCDIHMRVERYQKATLWVRVDDAGLDPGCNYSLFSILANVRNGVGFGGSDTGDGFVPISEPRGLPDDADPRTLKESHEFGIDGHSHSHLTLAEILNFDWTQTTKRRGFLNPAQFKEWERLKRWDDCPASWCADAWGASVKKITNEAMLQLIDGKEGAALDKLRHTYTQVEWEQSYSSCCKSFWSNIIPRLLRLNAPDCVRLVFWFDN